jgi:hypothetical protein
MFSVFTPTESKKKDRKGRRFPAAAGPGSADCHVEERDVFCVEWAS